MQGTNNFKWVKAAGSILLMGLTAGCASSAVAQNSPINATIEFGPDGCPTGANTTLVSQGMPGDRVIFTSNPLKTGDQFNEFELTFDPFVGRSYRSNNGVKRTPPLSRTSTPGRHQAGQTKFTFKYIINAENCAPIDPIIIIDR